ncbi:hypothetical protein MLD38_008919 [Melastoma candidum]|uniref:Uncharacterized protein n=1 Tax=Melastoma candidum TaxID=119954 RepID=A0ACB9RVJ2_9MYRT|nr:hypothetical protein MLD38_008919 [Melastoma candidum]
MDALIASYGVGDDIQRERSPVICRLRLCPSSLLREPMTLGQATFDGFGAVQVRGPPRREIATLLKRASYVVPGLCVVDFHLPLESLVRDDQRPPLAGDRQRFSRQPMLRQKLQPPKSYWVEFSEWQLFVNNERTRDFQSPEDPRPHISSAWAVDDARESINKVVKENKLRRITSGSSNVPGISCNFRGIDCKIGNKMYKIRKPPDS